MRVVRDVEHARRPPGQHLEAARKLDADEPVAQRARAHRQPVAQRVDRRDRARRVAELVGAAQRRMRESVALAARSAVAPLRALGGRGEVASRHVETRADARRLVDERLRADRGSPQIATRPAPEDARLLAADRLARVAEVARGGRRRRS